MAKTLSPTEIQERNFWFKNIFFPIYQDIGIADTFNYTSFMDLHEAAVIIYDTIINAAFTDVDHELRVLADIEDTTIGSRYSAETIASFIASLCADKQIYWEDIRSTSTTFKEVKDFKTTLLGKALADFECYVSDDPTIKQQATTTAASTSTVTSNATTAAMGGYKQSGPHSQDAINLIGQPNQKVMLSGYVFDIEADKINKNVPHAFITPINATSPYGKTKAKAEAVKFSSANGYTDMACYFTDINAANAFCEKCVAKFGTKFPGIHVAKDKADANGYFKVSTDFGECYVRAKWFNEQLEEDIEFEENLNKEKEKISKMSKDEYYAYMKDFCESHRNILD